LLGIVILNYKKWQLVHQCIDSIRETIGSISYRIYIVDNHSKNGSVEEFNKRYLGDDDVVILETDENGGFSKGNNIGARRAVDDGCQYLLIVNSDVVFLENAIKNMYEALLAENHCILTYPCVLNSDNSYQYQDCMVGKRDWVYDFLLTRDNVKKHMPNFVTKKYFKRLCSIEQPTATNMYFGCCYMVHAKKYQKLGMLDENVFLYYEELIFSMKAIRKKLQLVYVPNARIKHLNGASSNQKKMNSYINKSRYYYLKKIRNYPDVICKLDKKVSQAAHKKRTVHISEKL